MSRTAYHRAYYYANVERRRASARAARRKAREWQAVIRIVCEAVTDARNDKAHQAFMVGLDAAGGLPLRFKCEVSVDEILTDCSSHVNHPHASNARYWENSLKPVGEERGAILKSVQRPPITDTQRIVGKRVGERETVKSCRHRVRLRKGHNVSGEWTRPLCAFSPPEIHNRRVIRVRGEVRW